MLKLLVTLKTNGPVTETVVRDNVQAAIENWRANAGLSALDDEGAVGDVSVEIAR